ncbi:MAG TPA: CGNR zinc finger domain-containing protein [Gammaproteobacteria bacterium]|nr:CGNR zinc finger domain-containing protein [Gammaproteobacteria bacterium]
MQISGKPLTTVALDFANEGGRLQSYEALLDWNQKADFIGPNGRRNLSAGSDKAKAAALQEAQALSATLRSLFQAAARDEVLPQKALDHLNSIVQQTAAWRHIAACTDTACEGGRKINCGWDFKGAPPAAVLGPIVWRAVELLETGPLDRVKECPGEGCGWLFLDTSKNRSRQWCSMQSCGNVSKVRRFRERTKSA